MSPDSTVAPGYEGVKEAFEKQMADGRAWGAQLAVYKDGVLVVNLAGGQTSDRSDARPYTTETLVNMFSDGKSMEGVALAVLLSKKEVKVSYDDTISSVWPEYATHNKERVTIAEMMRHEGGGAWLSAPLTLFDLDNSDVAMDALANSLAKAPHTHGGKAGYRAYHGMMRGLYVNEIVRRVDPKKRSLDEFLRDEVLEPLGEGGNLHIGLPRHLWSRAADMMPFKLPKIITATLLGWTGLVPRIDTLSTAMFKQLFNNKTSDTSMGLLQAVHLDDPGREVMFEPSELTVLNRAPWRDAHASSANMHSSARTAAHVFSILAGEGEADGRTFWREETQQQALGASRDELLKYDSVILMDTQMTNGGWGKMDPEYRAVYCRESMNPPCYIDDLGDLVFYGWSGAGGNMMWACPHLNLSFSYLSNTMHSLQLLDERPRELLWHVVQAVENQRTG